LAALLPRGALFKTENKQTAWAGRWEQFQREKRQDVCRDLNARGCARRAINCFDHRFDLES
jgi:hypothetical protein